MIVISWNSCRERFETFTSVELFLLWKQHQSLRYVNMSWTSWKIHVGRDLFKTKINHFVTWTSSRERLEIWKINHFVYVNVVWTSCRGRLETFTLVELCFEKKNQSLRYVNIESWTSCRQCRVVNVLKHDGRGVFLKQDEHRVVIVMPWTSCRERFEIFTLVEQFFSLKKNQSLRYANIELWP